MREEAVARLPVGLWLLVAFSEAPNAILATTLQGSPGWCKPWPYLWLELLFVTIKCTSVRARLFWVSPHHATGTHCLLRSSVGEHWLGAMLRESVTNSEIFPIFAYSRLFLFLSFFVLDWGGKEEGEETGLMVTSPKYIKSVLC